MATFNPVYRQSYVEKDRCVRNSTIHKVPGVDMMQGFELSKDEFEAVFTAAADDFDGAAGSKTKLSAASAQSESRPPLARANGRLTRAQRKAEKRAKAPAKSAPRADRISPPKPASPTRGFRSGPQKPDDEFATPEAAAAFADRCRRDGAALQRATPADYEGAGALFMRAADARARAGLFCTQENADAHVEYAQNLSKRGLTPEAEYHLRTAADIFRMLNARKARKYGDVLLYMAVVIDRQGRLAEAENFYRSALAVYRANKLSDDNVRVAIDSLSNNLRAQGRGEEVETIVSRHFLGAAV